MLALFKESQEFNFESLKKAKVYTFFGAPVKIDRVVYDMTHTTAISVSGTFVINGIKIRGNWDALGNPIDIERCTSLLSRIATNKVDLTNIITPYNESILRLVQVDELGEEKK